LKFNDCSGSTAKKQTRLTAFMKSDNGTVSPGPASPTSNTGGQLRNLLKDKIWSDALLAEFGKPYFKQVCFLFFGTTDYFMFLLVADLRFSRERIRKRQTNISAKRSNLQRIQFDTIEQNKGGDYWTRSLS
jgi:hypothetical protein